MNEEARHTASPAELQEQLVAARTGTPFLLYRDGDGRQRIIKLEGRRVVTVGRDERADVPLSWDNQVSRLHAELECIAGEWTVSDDGLSRNGTFVNGSRLAGRARLRDGDQIRLGRTVVVFRQATLDPASATAPAGS